MSRTGKRGSWRWFAMLCLIAASRWIPEDTWPEVGSTLRTEAWACAVLALLSLALALLGRRRRPGMRDAWLLIATGAGLLAAPSFGVLLGGPAGDVFNRTVALCLVPVVVAVVGGIWADGAPSYSFWPGLAGLGGAMLVFPLAKPTDVLGYVGLFAPPIVVGAACVACRKVSGEIAKEWSGALLFLGGAVCLALMDARRFAASDAVAQPFPYWAVGVDMAIMGLAIFSVLRMDALRYASRYFVVPLVTIVEGLLILREGITLRLSAGIVLLTVASVMLLKARDSSTTPSGLGLT